jgi:hypothetical protein
MGATGPICVLNSQFKRGENVVFRMRVRTINGELLDEKGIKGITVELKQFEGKTPGPEDR